MEWVLELFQWVVMLLVIVVAILSFDIFLGQETGLVGLILHAYDSGKPVVSGVEGMIGQEAVVTKHFEESGGWLVGTVKLRGELWKARAPVGPHALSPGSQVTVEAARGLILDVARLSNTPGQTDAASRRS